MFSPFARMVPSISGRGKSSFLFLSALAVLAVLFPPADLAPRSCRHYARLL